MLRRLVPAAAALPLLLVSAAPASAASPPSDDESAYLRALRGGGAPAQLPPPQPALPPSRVPLDVAAINLSAAAAAPAAPAPAAQQLQGPEARYAAGALRAARAGAPLVARLTSPAQAAALGAQVAVVGVARGCDACVAEALAASLEAAARADATAGLAWYLVTNDTPQSAVDLLERRLRLEVPGLGEAGALPLVAVLDRAARRTGSKWLMPPSAALAFAAEAGEEEAGGGEAGGAALALAAIPYPSEVATFVADVVAGRLAPTLLGQEAGEAPGAAAAGAAAPSQQQQQQQSPVVELTSATWAATVLDPQQDVLLEAYLSNCPMCLCLAPRVAMAAQVARAHFPPSAAITVAAINVDLNERSMAWMPSESFPTLQMFNRRGGAAASVAHKLGGAQCSHLAGLAPSALPAHAPGSLPASSTATPPCVPSLDFTHPTAPGKMALPSVAALVAWMAANCSAPFELRKLRVPAQAVRGSRQRSPWASAFFPAAEGAAAAAAAEAPAAAAAAAAAAASGGDTVPLSALLEDMDAECKVFEAGVFDSMFAGHVVELVTAATASPPLPAAAGWAAALAAARAHAAAQAQWMQAGRDIRAYSAKEGPVPALGGLPGVGGSSAWLQGHLPRLQASALALKEAVQGPAVAYGAADAAWVAMEAAHEQSQACGAREVARAWMQDQDSMRCMAAALPMALALAEEEGRQRVA